MQSQPRAVIFIDGANFYRKLKRIASLESTVVSLRDFDYRRFADNLTASDEVTDIRYYIGAVKQQAGDDKEKSKKLYSDQQKFIAKLQQQNIEIILGQLIQHPDRSFHEKGVDVKIAVEMIRYAREDKCDVLYLLSSDTDLVPAVEEVQSLGKKVVYVGAPHGQSFGLTKASNHTILLRKEDVLPFLTIIEPRKIRSNEITML